MRIEKLYRMEDTHSYGMYNTMWDKKSPAAKSFKPGRNLHKLHPPPSKDFLLQQGLIEDGRAMSDFFFCWRSVPIMRLWIPYAEWLMNLHACGIKLAIYHCHSDDVIHGERQSIFASHVSKRQYNIPTYFKIPNETEIKIILDSRK